jgi:hypothetical protein
VADKILNIIIRAKDEASAKFKEITGLNDAQVASIGAAVPVIGAAGAAYVGALKVAGDLAMGFQDYAIAVGDTATKLQVSNDEAAALMEMASDFGVGIGTMETAFKNMAQHGIGPSLEGLMTVRNLLDQAGDPAERLALATELLGKGGADLLPVLDQLNNDQLRNYIDNLNEGQRISQEEYETALRQRDALDQVGDAWEGIKLQVGGWLAMESLPYLENILGVLEGSVSYLEGFAKFWQIITGSGLPEFDFGANVGGDHHGGFATGGEFEVDGPAGVDKTMVRFMASRGERVTVTPPGGDDRLITEMRGLRGELGRLARTLPITMRDAVEQAR